MNNLDNEIKKTLISMSENVNIKSDLLSSIKSDLAKEREIKMKKSYFRPNVLAAVLIITALFATYVAASGGLKLIISSSNHNDAINHYPSLEEVREIVDYSPKYTRDLNGHKFKFAQPADTSDTDDMGNKFNTHKEISFWYETDKGMLNLNTSPIVRQDDTQGEAISYEGLTLYYSNQIYKSVPPDYIVSEKEKELIDIGKLMIGYGGDKVEEQNTQSIIWVEKGITYHLLDMGADINKSDFIKMAKQVINAWLITKNYIYKTVAWYQFYYKKDCWLESQQSQIVDKLIFWEKFAV